MYEWTQTIGTCPHCGADVVEYVDAGDRSTFDCLCAVGDDYVRLDAYRVEVLSPDPLRGLDMDPVWAQRLAEGERNSAPVNTENDKWEVAA